MSNRNSSYSAYTGNTYAPQSDQVSTQTLLNACRNCDYKEEATNTMVFRNDLMSITKVSYRHCFDIPITSRLAIRYLS